MVQQASTAPLDTGDAVVSAVVFCTALTLCGIVVAGKPASLVLCPGQGDSGARRFIRFFRKGLDELRLLAWAVALAHGNLPLFWGAWFNVACSFAPGLLYAAGWGQAAHLATPRRRSLSGVSSSLSSHTNGPSCVSPSFGAVWEATTEDDGAVAARITDGLELLSCGELRKLEEYQSQVSLCSDRQCLFSSWKCQCKSSEGSSRMRPPRIETFFPVGL